MFKRVCSRIFVSVVGGVGAMASVSAALAQAPASEGVNPGAVNPGAIEREFDVLAPPEAGGALIVPSPIMPDAPDGALDMRFRLAEIEISGSTVFREDDLIGDVADRVGQEVSLADIYQVAAEITKRYADAGYPLSLAYIPAQEINVGAVRIVVVEGYIAEIALTGTPGPAEEAIRALGEKLKSERPISSATLERYLLLANDLPGVNVRAVLENNTTTNGAIKLNLDSVHDGFTAVVGLNNRGSSAIGRMRSVISASALGNLTGRESLSVSYVQTVDTKELSYFSLDGAYVLNAEGSRVSLSGTTLRSSPGIALLEDLDFDSEGWSLRAGFSHPIKRSRVLNLSVEGGFELLNRSSSILDVDNTDDKLRILSVGGAADFVNPLGGVSRIGVTLNQGLDTLSATDGDARRKSRADGSSRFVTVNADVSHIHPITEELGIYASVSGQLASRALLASSECGYGGSGFGRGFDNFEISGEDCLKGFFEVRHKMPPLPVKNLRGQLYGFYDVGVVRNHGEKIVGENRQSTGQSIGFGARVTLNDLVSGSLEYAFPLARDIALEGDRNGRLFFSLNVTY